MPARRATRARARPTRDPVCSSLRRVPHGAGSQQARGSSTDHGRSRAPVARTSRPRAGTRASSAGSTAPLRWLRAVGKDIPLQPDRRHAGHHLGLRPSLRRPFRRRVEHVAERVSVEVRLNVPAELGRILQADWKGRPGTVRSSARAPGVPPAAWSDVHGVGSPRFQSFSSPRPVMGGRPRLVPLLAGLMCEPDGFRCAGGRRHGAGRGGRRPQRSPVRRPWRLLRVTGLGRGRQASVRAGRQ